MIKYIGSDVDINIHNEKVLRAGIIPYRSINGNLHILLGKWYDDNILTILGGSCEKTSDNPPVILETAIQCAVREFKEETLGLIEVNLDNITHVIPYKRFFKKSGETESCLAIFIHMPHVPVDICKLYLDKYKTITHKEALTAEMGFIDWFDYRKMLLFKNWKTTLSFSGIYIAYSVYRVSHALREIVERMPRYLS